MNVASWVEVEPGTGPRARGPGTLRTTVLAAVLLGAVLVLASVLAAPIVAAAEPSPTLLPPGDPRSEGEGPGLVGAPLLVAAGVLALGAVSAALTLLYLRVTRDD